MTDDVLVVTVDETGEATGTAGRTAAHEGEGTLHLAISLQVRHTDGRWLIQRRALDKPVFGGRWANTCCTHPLPGEAPEATARRRVAEELGLEVADVAQVGTFVYRAVDPTTEMVEHEFDNVFVATVTEEPALTVDATEIAEVAWVDDAGLDERLAGTDAAPWFADVIARARAAA